jgi:phage baseplate assembly protein W
MDREDLLGALDSSAGARTRSDSPSRVAEGADIATEARCILDVVPGERRLRPDFGCRVHGLSRVETPAERHLAAVFVEEALALWAPFLGEVRAEVLASLDGVLHLALRVGTRWYDVPIRHRNAAAASARDRAMESREDSRIGGAGMEDTP